jgi:hypothetical protein
MRDRPSLGAEPYRVAFDCGLSPVDFYYYVPYLFTSIPLTLPFCLFTHLPVTHKIRTLPLLHDPKLSNERSPESRTVINPHVIPRAHFLSLSWQRDPLFIRPITPGLSSHVSLLTLVVSTMMSDRRPESPGTFIELEEDLSEANSKGEKDVAT